MQDSASKKAIIIGGGIGGVTAGIALQRTGFNVTVFERAEELREVGSGLPLWTNALRAFQKIGLEHVLETLGATVTAGSISTWRGDTLVDLRTEELLKRLGTINAVVHRAELLALLLETLGADKVQLGATCVGFTQDATGVCARFADGREVRGDVLIGADGLHSVIRAQLFGASKPRYAGYMCYRGLAHITRTELETWAWGKGYQFGVTPMSKGRAYWFAQFYTPEDAQDKAGGRKREMLDFFQDWHDPIPAVIEATAEEDILRNPIYENEPLRQWSHGHVTLLGDAAHTMTPNLGQGACQAIEDAVELAECLKAEQDIVSALKQYEKRRVRRTNRIRLMARLVGQVVQWENPTACRIRNAFIKRTPASLELKLVLWIIDYQVK
jgi:2-polyprenyl-6-methoxyphenol hydroxylase-like FAD-dependent oxidoreductase